MNFKKELSVALQAAEEAGGLQLKYASKLQKLFIERKDDRSPVSEVDRKSEAIIKKSLSREFPLDSFLCEESGVSKGSGNGRRWIIDPLDGTRPYLRGIPTYSVLIALEEAGDPVLGVIHLPAMGITCYATKGNGAYLNGKRIYVSKTATLKNSIGSALGIVEKSRTATGRQLLSLLHSLDYTYGFMDAYSYVCVACGKLDIAISLIDKPWDHASAACIVREAGGKFSDLKGNSTFCQNPVILSNGHVHAAAVRHFK
jgi:histidinol-phosphatase